MYLEAWWSHQSPGFKFKLCFNLLWLWVRRFLLSCAAVPSVRWGDKGVLIKLKSM